MLKYVYTSEHTVSTRVNAHAGHLNWESPGVGVGVYVGGGVYGGVLRGGGGEGGGGKFNSISRRNLP